MYIVFVTCFIDLQTSFVVHGTSPDLIVDSLLGIDCEAAAMIVSVIEVAMLSRFVSYRIEFQLDRVG